MVTDDEVEATGVILGSVDNGMSRLDGAGISEAWEATLESRSTGGTNVGAAFTCSALVGC